MTDQRAIESEMVIEHTADTADFTIESHSINFVPHNLRHGKVRDLFPLWFGANASITTPTLGALLIVSNFSLLWALVGLLIGLLLGGIITAGHSAQGPTLGLPQMIQSRAQFGFYGANLPLVIVVLMYLGYFATGAVLGGQAIAELFDIPVGTGIIIESVLNLILCFLGYKAIHKFQRYATPTFIIVFAILTVLSLVYINKHDIPLDFAPTSSNFQLTPFILTITLAVSYVMSYGPYVADYSRYLPENTSARATFWYTYSPLVIGTMWLAGLGALLTRAFPDLGPVEQFAQIGDYGGAWLRVVTLIIIALGIAGINSLNTYGAFISSLTIASSIYRRWKPTIALRAAFIVPASIVATVGAFLEMNGVLNAFVTFLTLLVAFLIPWSIINLCDFYFARKGHYNLRAIFDPDGIYGKWSSAGLIAYFLGCAVQIPFIDVPDLFQGPIADAAGFDISWVVGAIVSGVVYLALHKGKSQEPVETTTPLPSPEGAA